MDTIGAGTVEGDDLRLVRLVIRLPAVGLWVLVPRDPSDR